MRVVFVLIVAYLIFIWWIGNFVVRSCLRGSFEIAGRQCLYRRAIPLDERFIRFPAAFIIGALAVNWATYILATLFSGLRQPLYLANLIVVGACGILLFFGDSAFNPAAGKDDDPLSNSLFDRILFFIRVNALGIFIFILIAAVWTIMTYRSLYLKENGIYVGYSVFSDFGPHLSMIRSFSHGCNFGPTEYPHFPNGTINYHFMFLFFAANLEFIGKRLDLAFNLPSIISYLALLMLLYSLAVYISGRKTVGIIALVLFFFRSSFAFFTYLLHHQDWVGSIKSMLNLTDFIGGTRCESWGLWTQKVFVNQRHYPFSLALMILMIILFLPLFQKAVRKMQELPGGSGRFRRRIDELFLKRDAWMPEQWLRPVAAGIILGLSAFWNGAVLLTALIILFMMALFSKHRLELAIAAGLALVLGYLQTLIFTGINSNVFHPRLVLGFFAEKPTLWWIGRYYLEAFGILPFLLVLSWWKAPPGGRWLLLAFAAPLIAATCFLLSADMLNNHKLVTASVILLNIFAADFLVRLGNGDALARSGSGGFKPVVFKGLAGLFLFLMTVTGVIDLITLYNIDRKTVVYNLNDPMLVWAEHNTGPKDIFLTHPYVGHPLLLAGRKIFFGWSYFAWSAGYNTGEREPVVRGIYGSTDANQLKRLVKQYQIKYILINDDNRSSDQYFLNEPLIQKTFTKVYEDTATGNVIYCTR
jgi:hypothetical protein